MKSIRILLAAVSLLAIAFAAFQAWQSQSITVQVASLTRGQFIESLELDGIAVATNRMTIFAPNNGQLRKIELAVGDEVAVGQVLATITSASPPLLDSQSRMILLERISNAKDQRRRADSDAIRIRKDLDDVLKRKGTNNTSTGQPRVVNPQLDAEEKGLRRELDAAETARDQALTQWNVFRIQLGLNPLKEASDELSTELAPSNSTDKRANSSRSSDTQIDNSTKSNAKREPSAADDDTSADQMELKMENDDSVDVVAPYAGHVLQLIRSDAGPVAAGSPLLEIGHLDQLEFRFDVLTEDATKLSTGMRVSIRSPDESSTIVSGTIRSIGRVASKRLSSLGAEEMRTPIIVEVGNGVSVSVLGDGYRVSGEFQTEILENVVKVPLGALYRKDEAWWVYRLEQGRARETKVEVLKQNDKEAAIKSGLGDHEMVVMYPSGRIQDGSKISVR